MSARASHAQPKSIPMPLLLAIDAFSSINSGVSDLIVEVEVDRLPSGFFTGPRWVSLNSTKGQSLSLVESLQLTHFSPSSTT